MRYYVKEYDFERVEFWEIVGFLYDLDFEMYFDEYCVK